MLATVARSRDRFSFRLEPDKKGKIERAAAVRGLTLTDFAITTLLREAEEVLRDADVLVLSDADRDAFLDALDNPPAPTEKALRAAAQYKAARAAGAVR